MYDIGLFNFSTNGDGRTPPEGVLILDFPKKNEVEISGGNRSKWEKKTKFSYNFSVVYIKKGRISRGKLIYYLFFQGVSTLFHKKYQFWKKVCPPSSIHSVWNTSQPKIRKLILSHGLCNHTWRLHINSGIFTRIL